MESRPYFIFGDVVSVVLVGVLCGLACSGLVGPGWNMLVAMVIGMSIGMVLAFLIGVIFLFWIFGAMEVMIPTMLAGMLSAMFVSMAASMGPVSFNTVMQTGALIGVAVLMSTYVANLMISGERRE